MSAELHAKYLEVLIDMLRRPGHNGDDSTELMDRIERLLGLSEPASIIPSPFPPALLGPGSGNGVSEFIDEPFGAEPTQEAAHEISAPPIEPAVLDEPFVTDVVGEIAAPEIRLERVAAPARAIGSQTEACEPGCGQSFGLGTLGRHRAGCAEWLAYRSAHVHDVTDPNWPKPLPAAADDRGGSGDAHADRAAAKAADVWAERHPGEPSQRPLTPRMVETLDALRAAKGNGGEAARALGLANSGGIAAMIQTLRAEGRLPADIDALLEARKAERAGT